MLSYFEDFITLYSALHLPIGDNRKATYQSCVKNYLRELPDDYLPEHCNNTFYELLWVILSDLLEEAQEHFED